MNNETLSLVIKPLSQDDEKVNAALFKDLKLSLFDRSANVSFTDERNIEIVFGNNILTFNDIINDPSIISALQQILV